MVDRIKGFRKGAELLEVEDLTVEGELTKGKTAGGGIKSLLNNLLGRTLPFQLLGLVSEEIVVRQDGGVCLARSTDGFVAYRSSSFGAHS